ncbi:small ubiquitin-related modifier 2-like [Pistacia vera]|uniref:small ubiquitin-related modifier 2-like n=1 Tax=Pistacia vera TaxID=55513 RepID=UPI001262E186|nr:small ubiquitin-related modifier 2-like [Pistacia vera]
MNAPIKVIVKNQEGNKLVFQVKRDVKLRKVLNLYCEKQVLQYGTVNFLINGERFDHDLTPNEVKLEEGDEIDALLPANGGGHPS